VGVEMDGDSGVALQGHSVQMQMHQTAFEHAI
jgi:hypothetical protein